MVTRSSAMRGWPPCTVDRFRGIGAFSTPGPIQELRVRTFDTFQVSIPDQDRKAVTIIDIDERSLADPRLGQWRPAHACRRYRSPL